MDNTPIAPRHKAALFTFVVLVCWLAIIGLVTIASAITYLILH